MAKAVKDNKAAAEQRSESSRARRLSRASESEIEEHFQSFQDSNPPTPTASDLDEPDSVTRAGRELTARFREVSTELAQNRTRAPSITSLNPVSLPETTKTPYSNLDPEVDKDDDESFPVPDMPTVPKKLGVEVIEDDPTSIVLYLRQLNMILGKVKSDRLKKFYMVFYITDLNLQDRWKAIKEYRTGTFAQYVRAVMNFYPAAAAIQHGSKAGLDMIFARYRGLNPADRERFQRFHLHIRTEASKLFKETGGARPLMTNLEMVQKILGCLDDFSRRDVLARLNLKRERQPAAPEAAGSAGGGPGGFPSIVGDQIDYDPHTWQEVLEMCDTISRESIGAPSEYSFVEQGPPPAKVRPLTHIKMEDRDALIAGLPMPSAQSGTDEILKKLDSLHKQNQGWHNEAMSSIKLLEQEQAEQKTRIANLVQQQNQYQQSLEQRARAEPPPEPKGPSRDQEEYENGPPPGNYRGERYPRGNDRYGGPPPPRGRGNCFYCGGQGHFLGDCFARKNHLDNGSLAMQNGRVMVTATGQPLPMYAPDGGTLQKWVESISGKRSANMVSNWYYEEPQSYERGVEQALTHLNDRLDMFTQQFSASPSNWPRQTPPPQPAPKDQDLHDRIAEMYKMSLQSQGFH